MAFRKIKTWAVKVTSWTLAVVASAAFIWGSYELLKPIDVSGHRQHTAFNKLRSFYENPCKPDSGFWNDLISEGELALVCKMVLHHIDNCDGGEAVLVEQMVIGIREETELIYNVKFTESDIADTDSIEALYKMLEALEKKSKALADTRSAP